MKSNSTLYVGDLCISTLESHLLDLFSPYGPIATIKIIRNPKPSSMSSDCYAYINFERPEDAKKALDLNFTYLNNKQIRVMFYNKEKRISEALKYNIIVRNLPQVVNNKMLYDTFSVFGDILSCKVAYDNGVSKGFGFVSYRDKISLKKAIKFGNDTNMKGNKLKVSRFQSRDERESKKNEVENNFTNVYMKNFGNLSESELKRLMSVFGEVTSFWYPMVDGKSKGVAFCNYSEHQSALKAIEELHNHDFNTLKERYNLVEEEVNVSKEGDEQEPENKQKIKKNVDSNEENIENENTDSEIEEDNADFVQDPFYCQRAQSKAERQEALRNHLAQLSIEGLSFKRNLYITNIPENYSDKEIKKLFLKYGNIINFKLKKDTNSNKQFCYVCYSNADEACIALEKGNDLFLDGTKLNVTYFKTKKEREKDKDNLNMLYSGYNPYETKPNTNILDKRQMGGDLFNLVLSMAGIFQDDWKRMGIKDDYTFADRITKALLERPSSEVRNMMGLGNVLSKNIEDILNDIKKKE